MNLDDVRSKIEVLESNRAQIKRLRELSEADFGADPVYLDSALHRLQTSVQALLDVGTYVVGALGRQAPRTSGDLVTMLEEAGCIGAEEGERYRRMVAFRNRVVHLYNRIDAGMVYTILRDHADDIERFRKALVAIIARNPDR
jgi:uncharacterized protein YutE (UPF0331/DUF86 family)